MPWSVVTANNVADVLCADTDLAIFYGKAPPEGWDCIPLFDKIITPVSVPASPVFLLDYGKEAPNGSTGLACRKPSMVPQSAAPGLFALFPIGQSGDGGKEHRPLRASHAAA